MTSIAYHGGACCGARHIHGYGDFHEYNKSQVKGQIQQVKKSVSMYATQMLIESILTEYQRNQGWHDYLTKELGFKELITWRNPNTGASLTMYVLTRELEEEHTARAAEDAKLKLAEAEKLKLAAEEAARELAATVMPVVESTVDKPVLRRRKKLVSSAVSAAKPKPLLKRRKKVVV